MVMVSMLVAVGVTGLVEKLVALHAGSGEPVPVTVQVRLTGEAYELYDVRVTVEVAELPAATAAGVVAAMVKFGPVVYLTTKASVPPPGFGCSAESTGKLLGPGGVVGGAVFPVT